MLANKAMGSAAAVAVKGVKPSCFVRRTQQLSTSGVTMTHNYMRVRDFERPRSSLGKKDHLHKQRLGVPKEPEKNFKYDKEFAKVATFQSQMESLALRGFRRPYKAYQPPQDMELKFMQVCAETVPGFSAESQSQPVDLSKIELSDGATKALVLNALSSAMGGHDVPNSLVHTMTSLDKVLTFYSTPVDARTSYERMEAAANKGHLPPNLHVQLDPHRFDPEKALANGNDKTIATVTAFPRSSTILSTPEAIKRYGKGYKAKHEPWLNLPDSNKDPKFDD